MEYIREIISFIVGAVAGGVTMKFYSVRKNADHSVRQRGIVAGGDVAGRDINK